MEVFTEKSKILYNIYHQAHPLNQYDNFSHLIAHLRCSCNHLPCYCTCGHLCAPHPASAYRCLSFFHRIFSGKLHTMLFGSQKHTVDSKMLHETKLWDGCPKFIDKFSLEKIGGVLLIRIKDHFREVFHKMVYGISVTFIQLLFFHSILVELRGWSRIKMQKYSKLAVASVDLEL